MKTSTHRRIGLRMAGLLSAAACLLLAAPAFEAAGLDLCGCATVPNLQPFDTTTGTYPTGTSDNGTSIRIPLPADGILKFSSFNLARRHISFARNAANTPVTILVSGDVHIVSTQGCCYSFDVSGSTGSNGGAQFAGVGALGGPGGFRGGDAASQGINGAAIGGPGFGPGGGAGGTASPLAHGIGGTFFGLPELTPIAGGSGGGGGASTSASDTSCSGGGGGGGGGALLIVANGMIEISDYQLFAEGGNASAPGNGSCGSYGGGGSGGAIRLVANRFIQGGIANVLARGFGAGSGTNGGDGRIRLESVDASAQTQFNTTPPALRIVGPTPLANPIAPTVAITSVGGSAVPAVPQGTFGAIDIILPAPGPATVAVATTGVPGGTTVAVTVKPRIGGQAVLQTVPLTNCTGAGACDAQTTFNLAAGAYVVEARATFQLQ